MRTITVTRVQKVQIPVSDDFTLGDFCDSLNNSLFDNDAIKWDEEEMIEEDYSYAPQDSEFEDEKNVYRFKSPYALGTLYSDITCQEFYKYIK